MRALADKIIAAVPTARSISIESNNISSLGALDGGDIRRSLESELARRGVHTVAAAASPEAQVRLTLSEGTDGYIWTAEVHHGDALEVAVVSAKKEPRNEANTVPSMSLKRSLLSAGSHRMLDAYNLVTDCGTNFIDLDESYLNMTAICRSGIGLTRSPISGLFPTRDPRGQILRSDGTWAGIYIAGVNCTATIAGEFQVICDPKLPVAFGEYPYAAGRNYFTAFPIPTAHGQSIQAKFYSAAIDHSPRGAGRYLLAELDGKTRLYQTTGNSTEAVATFEGWGDDVVSVRAGCDDGWQILASAPGDWTQSDQLQLYEIQDRQAVPVGQPLSFPGPVEALWPGFDDKSARVVSRNLQTGMYEASIVTVSCGN